MLHFCTVLYGKVLEAPNREHQEEHGQGFPLGVWSA